jgi:ABC-type sugar transport system permease subunit
MNKYSSQKKQLIFLFLLPASALYALFFIKPAIEALYLSLYKWDGISPTKTFIGLNNYKELFMYDEKFWPVAIKNTLLLIFVGGLIIFAFSFLFGSILTEKFKGRQFLRATLFFPSILQPICVVILWNFIFDNKGLLNKFLEFIKADFLKASWNDSTHLFWSILVCIIWVYTGWYSVIILAGLDRIPPSIIESAQIDGVNQIALFFKIKLPMIWDILVTSIVLWSVTAIKMFAFQFAWGSGIDIPQDGATTLAVYMYVKAFGVRTGYYRAGYASAMGVVMLIMVVFFYVFVRKILRREQLEY